MPIFEVTDRKRFHRGAVVEISARNIAFLCAAVLAVTFLVAPEVAPYLYATFGVGLTVSLVYWLAGREVKLGSTTEAD